MSVEYRRVAVVGSRWQNPVCKLYNVVFPGERRTAAGTAVCQPYSLFALAKLAIGREIHPKIQQKFGWMEMNWYAQHTGNSGIHFCYFSEMMLFVLDMFRC